MLVLECTFGKLDGSNEILNRALKKFIIKQGFLKKLAVTNFFSPNVIITRI